MSKFNKQTGNSKKNNPNKSQTHFRKFNKNNNFNINDGQNGDYFKELSLIYESKEGKDERIVESFAEVLAEINQNDKPSEEDKSKFYINDEQLGNSFNEFASFHVVPNEEKNEIIEEFFIAKLQDINQNDKDFDNKLIGKKRNTEHNEDDFDA